MSVGENNVVGGNIHCLGLLYKNKTEKQEITCTKFKHS